MRLMHGKTLGTLAAATLVLCVAGCQRAGEQPPADGAVGTGTALRATQATARPAGDRLREPTAKAATPAVAGAAPPETRTMGGPPADASRTMGAAAERIDDASITGKVATALAMDRQLRSLRIDVDTQNGIVTLSGPAPTATAKEHAAEVARTVHGVVSINNQLTLQTG